MIKKVIHNWRINKQEFSELCTHFIASLVFTAGLILWGYFLGGTSVVFADTQTTITKNTDTHFDQGSVSDTQVTGSGTGAYVELAGTTGPDGTLYKRVITVDNSSGGTLTNYQVKVTLDTATLISGGKLESDCDDIRFLDSDDSSQIDYWIQEEVNACNSVTTDIWVEIPSFTTGTYTFYLYYGSALASAQSNAANTFTEYVDFSVTTPISYAGGQDANSGQYEVQESGKTLYMYGNNWKAITKSVTISGDEVMELEFRNTGTQAEINGFGVDADLNLSAPQTYQVHGTQSWGIAPDTSYSGSGSYETVSAIMNDFSGSYSYYFFPNDADAGQATQVYYKNVRIRQYNASVGSSSVGSEVAILPSSGTWTSPTDSNVIDLGWNGGWGDGATRSSTAFAATVANVTSDATIEFKIRVADTAGNLSGESWSTIGTINTGTSFTADKDTMDALSLDEGIDGRFAQIQAAYAQTDGNNPQLDSFSLTYMADDTAPATNASSLAMLKAAGGDSVSDGGWTNGSGPYFSWTAGSDTESGINGYCLYLGTDTNGDPATDKGLLGTSPVSTTGTTCQFIVDATNVDLSTGSYQGGTWLTSSASAYYLNVKAVDTAGNVFSGASEQFSFKYDDTIPSNPSFMSLPSDFISTKSATMFWSTSGGDAPADSHSGVSGLQYRVGASGTWYGDNHTGDEDADDLLTHDGSYSFISSPDFSNIQEGNNLIYLRTWDTAGNVSTTYVSGVLKVNTIAPGVPQNLAVVPSNGTTNSYAFSWDAPATFTGQESNLTYCYTVNSVPNVNNCSFTAAGVTSLSAGAYATQPGENTMYIVAKDEADNIDYDTHASVVFTYSGSAPGIPSNMDIADISIKATSNWKLAISWEEPSDVGAGVSSYKVYRSTSATSCSSDFGSFTEIGTTGGTSYADSGLSQTDYYYCAKACDSANNCGAVSSTVTAYPDGKFTSAASLASGPTTSSITTKKATVTWGTDRTSDSKVAFGTSSGSYNNEEVSNSTHVTDHTINLTNLNAGTTYYYVAKWTDEDGNTGQSDEQTFTTDPAPVVKDISVSNISISSALLQFTVTGATKAKIYYGPTTTFGGLAEITTSTTESTYTIQLTGLEDGTKYFYKINTFDSEEEEYEGSILDITTLPRPRVSNVRVQEVPQAANPTMLVTWDTNTDISSIITYYPEGNPAAAQDQVDVARISGRHRMVLKGLLPNKQYSMVVKGIDKAGNEAASDTQSFTTSTDTRPPVLLDLKVEGAVNLQTVSENKTVQLIVSWNTDEPSTSQVEFGEGTGTTYSQQTQEDKNLTSNHVVIISGLTPSKVYHFRAISRDEEGNTGKSIDTVTIAPRVTDDALNLVLSNLRETFGFLDSLVK